MLDNVRVRPIPFPPQQQESEEPLRIPVPQEPGPPQRMPSSSTDRTYDVDLAFQTCSCDDFQTIQRQRFQAGDMRRLCRHLCKLYVHTAEYEQLDPMKKAIIGNGFGVRTSIRILRVDEIDQDVAILWNHDDPWWDVFAKDRHSEFQRYGYNIEEKRWSYGDPPPGLGRVLRKVINEQVGRL